MHAHLLLDLYNFLAGINSRCNLFNQLCFIVAGRELDILVPWVVVAWVEEEEVEFLSTFSAGMTAPLSMLMVSSFISCFNYCMVWYLTFGI